MTISKLRRTFVAMVLGTTALVISPQIVSAGTLDDLRAQGYATVVVANDPPYSNIKSDGHVTGAAPDVARAVMKKLGVPELKAKVMGYGAMIPALQARRVDMATSGLYIKPKRCESIIYSEPDLCGAEAFAVAVGNPFNIKTYEDIAANPEVTMTTCAGCAEEAYALERGVKPSQIKVFTDPPSGIKMLQQGRVNVFALSGLSIQYFLEETKDDKLQLVMPVKGVPIGCAGAAFNSADKDFRDAYDKALTAIKDSGEFAKIIEPYGFSAEAAFAVKRDNFCPGN
jgi:polar amino acid transport system substrate-binding protein